MTGTHQVVVQNRRVQYKFTLTRNITILRGDSATGKTTMIEMIAAYQQNGEQSGVNISCDKKCVVLSGNFWRSILSEVKDSIVFIDEGEHFVTNKEFAEAIQNSDNYYVIATRSSLFNLSYSVNEVYGIRNISGNKYQGTKKLYSEFYPLHDEKIDYIDRPDIVVVEDSNAGYEFFRDQCEKHGIECLSAHGNGNVFALLRELEAQTVLVIVDGAAFGQQMERVLSLRKIKNIILYLPESFEWIILRSGLIEEVHTIMEHPAEHIESSEYYTWERFFTKLLTESTQGSHLKYSKSKLNESYLQAHESGKIMSVIPRIEWND